MKPGWAVLMFPDASDERRGSFLTQVPQDEIDRGVPVEDMTHQNEIDRGVPVEHMTYKPLGFLSRTFNVSQQRWATVEKEGFDMVSTFKRLEYLLWNGVHIYTGHGNWCAFSTRRLACRPSRRRRRSVWTSGRRNWGSTIMLPCI